MMMWPFSRREFLKSIPLGAFLLLKNPWDEKRIISCNGYNWITFYQRAGKVWGQDWEACIQDYARSGLKALEPSIGHVEDLNKLIPTLKKYDISLPSIYVGSILHESKEADLSIQRILAIADRLKSEGTNIIVTNPSPLKNGARKSDSELACQAEKLNTLGNLLKQKGITLAYHTHDVEFRENAREFHYVLQHTKPENLAFCMDVHWVYRGSGNSEQTVFDILKTYGNRIAALHIRQSQNGIWTETFSEKGDIDYVRFAKELKKQKIKPHLVIEQCLEAKTKLTMDAAQAHAIDLKIVKALFN
jgi:inosose dehydratase